MGMANDLDARGGTREERNKERNERREVNSHKGTGGRDLQTTYYANDATITSQFPAGCLSLVLYVL